MTLYVCQSCGNVVAEQYCAACDTSSVSEYDDSDEHECATCGDTFDTEQGLRSHSRIHD